MKPYATLTTAERWQWHAEVYAFRIISLGEDRTERRTPCDEEGKWYDERLIGEAERRLRNMRAIKSAKHARDDSSAFEALDVENEWARQRGFVDFENYKTVERIDHIEACCRVIRSFIAAMPQMPGRETKPHKAAAALGVKAREYTKEELRAGRVALGLEKAEAAE